MASGTRDGAPWAEFRRLDTRMSQLQDEVQRMHDEVEACSVLVLSLDASAASGNGNSAAAASGGGNAASEAVQAETTRLAARMDVLETAWANRGSSAARDVDDSIQRLEKELMDLWRQVRSQEDAHLQPLRELTHEVQRGLQDVGMQVKSVREETLQKRDGALDDKGLEDLVSLLTAELGRTAADFERRCDRLEEGVARIEAGEVAQRAERQQNAELNRIVELLVAQRRQDIQATNVNHAEINTQLKQLREKEEREANWHVEADQLRGEIDDMKISKIPAIAQQSTRASTLIAEGLQALRKEVLELRDRREKTQSFQEEALDTGLEVARLKAEVEDLRQQVSKALIGGFDDRLLSLRADFAAEVESAVHEVRESWADSNRRLAALEPWQRESAQLHAQLRQLKIERQEDRSHWNLSLQDEMLAQRAAITEGLEARLAGFRHEGGASPGRPLRALAADGNKDFVVSGAARTAGQGGAPVVLGNRIEWALSGNALLAARRTRAGRKPEPVVTGELEVAGIRCRLKFYPDGSPLKTVDGHCSLYLLALNPVAVRFHLFAGSTVSPLLECSYDRRRDQGRHDLCHIEDALDEDGGIIIGAELLDVTPLLASSE